MAAAMEQAAIIYLDKRGILFCRLLWGGERMGQERGLMVVEEREGGECIMKNGDEKIIAGREVERLAGDGPEPCPRLW